MIIFFVLGPPGAGKGTQCKLFISKTQLQAQHISVGDFLREKQRKGLPTGHESIAEALRTGLPMPGSLLAQLLANELEEQESSGVSVALIDGFPRSADQAEEFEKKVDSLSGVVHLTCAEEVARERCVARRDSSRQIEDDARFTMRHHDYLDKIGPIVKRYGEKYIEVDTTGTEEDVAKHFQQAVEAFICRQTQ